MLFKLYTDISAYEDANATGRRLGESKDVMPDTAVDGPWRSQLVESLRYLYVAMRRHQVSHESEVKLDRRQAALSTLTHVYGVSKYMAQIGFITSISSRSYCHQNYISYRKEYQIRICQEWQRCVRGQALPSCGPRRLSARMSGADLPCNSPPSSSSPAYVHLDSPP